ncbi:hypothetical protein H2248_011018 [Termitomyces sp. 'cryptogamus']|nr:hypothetical protein H2248_011018 [Termitomyces sp. 'cryptogamus']
MKDWLSQADLALVHFLLLSKTIARVHASFTTSFLGQIKPSHSLPCYLFHHSGVFKCDPSDFDFELLPLPISTSRREEHKVWCLVDCSRVPNFRFFKYAKVFSRDIIEVIG